jgi:hypothetical protein
MRVNIAPARSVTVTIFSLKDGAAREARFAEMAQLSREPARFDVRVVACGGDGTVKWVIACLAKASALSVPIGVIPFGTGNDLARVMGWGHKAPDPLIGPSLSALKRKLLEIDDAERISLDVWLCTVGVAEQGGRFEEIKDKKVAVAHEGRREMTHEMINYFSLGADGELMFEFEKNRGTTQLANKAVYARKGFVQTIAPPPPLSDFVAGATHGAEGAAAALDIDTRHRQLLFLNIPSYGAGADPWFRRSDSISTRKDGALDPQFVGDGRIEVLTVRNTFHTGMNLALGSNLGIARVNQGSSFDVALKPGATVYFQADGEALRAFNATHVKVRFGYQVQLLRHETAKARAGPEGRADQAPPGHARSLPATLPSQQQHQQPAPAEPYADDNMPSWMSRHEPQTAHAEVAELLQITTAAAETGQDTTATPAAVPAAAPVATPPAPNSNKPGLTLEMPAAQTEATLEMPAAQNEATPAPGSPKSLKTEPSSPKPAKARPAAPGSPKASSPKPAANGDVAQHS